MKTIWQIFKKYPVAITFYLIYFWVFISCVERELDFKRILRENHGKWPYGVREWDGALLILFAGIFAFITMINAGASKQPRFYLFLLFFIIVLPFIWWQFAK